jgi:hypothetical protein
MSKKKEAAQEPGRLIYCGPNIPGGALQRYTVFKGGLPAHLELVFEKYPAAKSLIVPVGELARVEQAVRTKGTPENTAFGEVLKGGV